MAHLVVADGGFDAQRENEDQEALSQKLIVCETVAALACLRQGGTFVLKMFGCQTSTIRYMMMEINKVFNHLYLLKPISSRPASAERYLVATGFRGMPPSWDPQAWRDSIFLGQGLGHDVPPPEEDLHFAYMLDLFDHEMLNLNLTACFSILSYMETKQRGIETNQALLSYGEKFEIPIERYRRAWRL